jgi:hypothetical protein
MCQYKRIQQDLEGLYLMEGMDYFWPNWKKAMSMGNVLAQTGPTGMATCQPWSGRDPLKDLQNIKIDIKPEFPEPKFPDLVGAMAMKENKR